MGMVGADFLRPLLVALPNHASAKTMDKRLAFNGVDRWRLRVTMCHGEPLLARA